MYSAQRLRRKVMVLIGVLSAIAFGCERNTCIQCQHARHESMLNIIEVPDPDFRWGIVSLKEAKKQADIARREYEKDPNEENSSYYADALATFARSLYANGHNAEALRVIRESQSLEDIYGKRWRSWPASYTYESLIGRSISFGNNFFLVVCRDRSIPLKERLKLIEYLQETIEAIYPGE